MNEIETMADMILQMEKQVEKTLTIILLLRHIRLLMVRKYMENIQPKR